MDKNVTELVEYSRELCGLEAYTFKAYHIFYHLNVGYTFCTEWIPSHLDETKQTGDNPTGAAIVEIHLQDRSLQRLVFVKNTSFATEGALPSAQKEELLPWIEQKTNLAYGRQFQLVNETKQTATFDVCIDHIPIAPRTDIEVQFNQKGQLTLFSIDGTLPSEDEVDWEPYALTSAKTDPILPGLCREIVAPIEKTESWERFFIIDQVFISNYNTDIIPAKVVNEHPVYIEKNLILQWTGETNDTFTKKKIHVKTDFTWDDVFSDAENPNQIPIAQSDEQLFINEATRVLQINYPQESGQWCLTALYKEHNHVIAEIQPTHSESAFTRKIKIFMNDAAHAVNFVDNKFLFQLLERFTAADPSQMTKDDAFQQLVDHITIEPAYVYNRQTKHYEIHGEVICPYAVHAKTGELVAIETVMA